MPDTALQSDEAVTVTSPVAAKRQKLADTSSKDMCTPATNGKSNGHTNGSCEATVNGEQRGVKRKNQFGEVSDGKMTLNDWVTQWENGRTKFHKAAVHPMLQKHVDRLVEGTTKPIFYLPLCGKSVDLRWLLDRGYTVIGCEIAELGIKQFFTENNIKYQTEKMSEMEGTIYKGTDDDITIFACDFFKLNSAIMGKVDCVWDRGSMAAINPDDRKRYSEVMIELMKSNSRYLLDMFQLEHHKFAGPPHNFDPEEADKLFGAKCKVEQVEHRDVMCAWQKTWGTSYFHENVFFITSKKSD